MEIDEPISSTNSSSANEEEINYLNKQNEKFSFGKCKICSDTATGIHYGISTCEGCKVIIFLIYKKNHLYKYLIY